MSDPPTIGLIAGQGALPVLVARGIRTAGARVGCVGLRGQYVDELPELCDDFAEIVSGSPEESLSASDGTQTGGGAAPGSQQR